MELATMTDEELEELQAGAADLLLALSIEKVRRMPCCDRCETGRKDATLAAPKQLEVIHE